MSVASFAVVRQKSTGLYLRMTKFDPVTVRFASSDLSSLEGSSPEQVAVILTNANTRIHLEVEVPRQDAQEMTDEACSTRISQDAP